MIADPLFAPAKDAAPEDRVDWLELKAFFDRYKRARLDELTGSLDIQQDDTDQNTGDADAALDAFREEIEAEVMRRQAGLLEAYPFELSEDGELLRFRPNDDRSASSFYLLCLVLSHATRSPLLARPPIDGAIRGVRKRQFQILSSLAVAGACQGPALSLGWPRINRPRSITTVVTEACDMSGTGTARLQPAATANPNAKDGGIDVLAWSPANDGPPPMSFWFAQAASGHGWEAKSAKGDHEAFLRDYFDIEPQCNYEFVTICPFMLSRETRERVSKKHGLMLDRTRAPLKALHGLRLSEAGVFVEEANRAKSITGWLATYRRRVRLSAA